VAGRQGLEPDMQLRSKLLVSLRPNSNAGWGSVDPVKEEQFVRPALEFSQLP